MLASIRHVVLLGILALLAINLVLILSKWRLVFSNASSSAVGKHPDGHELGALAAGGRDDQPLHPMWRELKSNLTRIENTLRNHRQVNMMLDSLHKQYEKTHHTEDDFNLKLKSLYMNMEGWRELEETIYVAVSSLERGINATVPLLSVPKNLLGGVKVAEGDLVLNQLALMKAMQNESTANVRDLQERLLALTLIARTADEHLAALVKNFTERVDSGQLVIEGVLPSGNRTNSTWVDAVLRQVASVADQIELQPEGTFRTMQKLTGGTLETMLKISTLDNTTRHEAGMIPTLIDIENNRYVLMRPVDLTAFFEDSQFIFEVFLLLVVSFLLGLFFDMISLPSFFGYIIAGIILGPSCFNAVQGIIQLSSMGQMGVLLMLFMLGLEFSPEKLRETWRVSLIGGLLFSMIFVVLSLAIGTIWLACPWEESLLVGVSISFSSTAVALRCLGHENSQSGMGRAIVVILIIQDVLLCFYLAVFPTLAQGFTLNAVVTFAMLIMRAAMLVGTGMLLNWFVSSAILSRLQPKFSSLPVSDLYGLGLLFSCVLLVAVAHLLDISAEFGAFLAGALLANHKSHSLHAEAYLKPVADVFAVLFFNSIGLHIDARFLAREALLLVGFSFLIIAAKAMIMFGLLFFVRCYSARHSALVALNLSQISEFAFVLGGRGKSTGLISRETYYLLAGTTSLCLMLVPLLWRFVAYLDVANKCHEGKMDSHESDNDDLLPIATIPSPLKSHSSN